MVPRGRTLRRPERLARSTIHRLINYSFDKPISHIHAIRYFSSANFFLIVLVLLAHSIGAQQAVLPKEIDGYKLHRAKIHTSPASGTGNAGPLIKFGEPKLLDVSLTGVSFEMTVESNPLAAAGTIDYFTFENFYVNGIPVEIEKFEGPVSFKRGTAFVLPRPIKLFISSGGVLEVAWNQFRNAQDKWLVTGRVLAFGTFRKMGLTFRRVVPVDVKFLIKNPLPPAK
jgi:hypothetical protein